MAYQLILQRNINTKALTMRCKYVSYLSSLELQWVDMENSARM